MDSIKCFKCGKDGHIRRDCPQLKQGKKANYKCFSCGKHGHIARECTEMGQSSDLNSPHTTMPVSVTPTPRNPVTPSSIQFIDSHCHIDYVLERFRYHSKDFQKFQHDHSFPSNFAGCITTFCDPSSFSSFGICEELLENDQIWGTFGFHPHNAKYYNMEMEEKLLQHLEHPKTVGLGEIGLDYSVRSQSDPEVQKQVFARQIGLAESMGKPLVIHCREAENDVLDILSSRLPKNWKIHLHCYTGDFAIARKFFDHFPNLYLGISGIVTFSKATEVHGVAYDVPLDRFILETDAPYLIPSSVGKTMKWNHPGLIPLIAEEIAKIKGINVDTVLEYALQNTKKLYSLQV